MAKLISILPVLLRIKKGYLEAGGYTEICTKLMFVRKYHALIKNLIQVSTRLQKGKLLEKIPIAKDI